jgi:hypothetical protein
VSRTREHRRAAGRALLPLAIAVVVLAVAGCGRGGADSGGMTGGERASAQEAVDVLQGSNISSQLVTITRWVQATPAACRIRRVSESPSTYRVFLFWIPWLAAAPYVWVDMHLTDDSKASTFHLGTAQPVLPGGRLNRDGRTINRASVDSTLLSRYGAEQAKKSQKILRARGGTVFEKPGATCQLLVNGSLRVVPST